VRYVRVVEGRSPFVGKGSAERADSVRLANWISGFHNLNYGRPIAARQIGDKVTGLKASKRSRWPLITATSMGIVRMATLCKQVMSRQFSCIGVNVDGDGCVDAISFTFAKGRLSRGARPRRTFRLLRTTNPCS
jgi:hypothetical protein